MKVLFINNADGGIPDYKDITPGTTMTDFVVRQLVDGSDSSDYLIRVNHQPVTKDYVLHENDRITITPTKIKGAYPVSS